MTGDRGVVIVGASLAGATTAEALRTEGYAGPITLIGAERHFPYSRPPLSKQVLAGTWPLDRTVLQNDEELAGLDVRYRPGERATAVDVNRRTVTVAGSEQPFEHLVIATGVDARTLGNPAGLAGVHPLRTIDDVVALRDILATPRHVAVVGAGVLGCEIASALVCSGHRVALIGRALEPHIAGTGGHVAARIASSLADHGVELVMGRRVTGLRGTTAVSALELSDWSVVPADVVISAIGSIPAVGWLADTDLDLRDGVRCDARGAAAPGIYAVGDVARWEDPDTGVASRTEHQATAIEQALSVARTIATGEESEPIVPFFWSEIFGDRLLVHGRLDEDVPLEVIAGDLNGPGFVAVARRKGRTTGILGWNMPREFRQQRAHLHTAPSQTLSI